jgi:hypothetical protein
MLLRCRYLKCENILCYIRDGVFCVLICRRGGSLPHIAMAVALDQVFLLSIG